MSIDIEPPMPPKRLATRDLEKEQKTSRGFFSRFRKKVASQKDVTSLNIPDASELRKKLGLDNSGSLSVEKLHEQLQQDADSFADNLSKRYDEEQAAHIDEPSIPESNKGSSMVADDLLDAKPYEPAPISGVDTDEPSIPETVIQESPILESNQEDIESPIQTIKESDPVHEEERLDIKKEVDSVLISSTTSMVPDFLVSDQESIPPEIKPSEEEDEKQSDNSSWADELNALPKKQNDDSSFAREPEPVEVKNPEPLPEPVFLNNLTEESEEKTQPVEEKTIDKNEEIIEKMNKPSKKSKTSKKPAKVESKKVIKKVTKKGSKKPGETTKSYTKSATKSVGKSSKKIAKKDIAEDVVKVSKPADSFNALVEETNNQSADSEKKEITSVNSWNEELTPAFEQHSSLFSEESEELIPIPQEIPSEIHLDADKVDAFAQELSVSTDTVAKENHIDSLNSKKEPVAQSLFDMAPIANSDTPALNSPAAPTLTTFEDKKPAKRGFLSKLFGKKSPSVSTKVEHAHPDSLEPSINPAPLVASQDIIQDKIEPEKPVVDSSIPLEAADPFKETSKITNKRASTLHSIIDSGKLDVLFVDKNGSIQSNEDELLTNKSSSDDEFVTKKLDSENVSSESSKYPEYISSFAHDIDILIDAAKESISTGDMLTAKKKYNEAKQLYAASELEPHTRELLYITLKDLFDVIHLKLLEQEAKSQLGE